MKQVLNFYDLDAWQQAHAYRLNIFKISNEFPQKYQFSLGQQIQRAAISIGSNIAEGYGRHNKQEKRQFYRIARGSLLETQDQLFLAKDLLLIDPTQHAALLTQATRVQQLLSGLLRSLETGAAISAFRVPSYDGANDG